MRRIALLLTWALIVWATGPQILEAQQTGTVGGRVITEGGQPLAGAQVALEGTSLGSLTNRSGRYLILNVPAGDYTVRVESMGYSTVSTQVSVAAGQVTTQDFQLGEEAVALEELRVTVGSRAAHTAADELPVPVDVFPEAKLAEQNNFDFLGTIEQVAPSIYVPQEQISDLASGLRPFQLRGMSPDQALVLINGKRRHKTASVMVFGNSSPGSSGVDLNAIPTMAIGQVEILRDGASAQYGSDAIAGVLNLGLKNNVSPLTVELGTGKYFPTDFPNDGWRGRVSANWGFELFDGVLNVTGEYQRRTETERAGVDPRPQLVCGDQPDALRPPTCDDDDVGDIDGDGVQEVIQKNNPVPQPNHLIGDGRYENELFFANYERPVSDDETVYLFGGVSTRTDLHTGFYRRANDDRNWPELYPIGFLPTFDVDTRDLQIAGGVRGIWNEWNYDIGGQWGQNKIDTDITNTHNASLGPSTSEALAPGIDGMGTCNDGLPCPPNTKKVYAGTLINAEVLGTVDVNRRFDVGLSSPMTLALGAHIRGENYQIQAGERASYVNGFHPTQWGRVAAAGSQVFPGWRPDDEVNDWRTNLAFYAEAEADLSEQILANVAGRFENYSDFGSTVTGKVALRVQPVEDVIIRGSASTGFRAPTQGQIHWKHISTGFQTTDTGDQVAFEIGEFPVGAEEARLLGARQLEEEKSVNLAGGIAVTPVNNLNITVDGYWIDVTDAIVLSGTIQGDEVETILADFNATAIKYMTNAIDFTTKGLDITANYRWLLAEEQLVELDAAFNLNRVDVGGDQNLPQVLIDLGEQYLSAGEIDEMENEKPQEKAVATARYRWAGFNARLQGQFFGGTRELINVNPDVPLDLSNKYLLNASLGYEFANGLQATVGMDNITDEMPDLVPDGYNFLGIFPFAGRIVGVNGRRAYVNFRYSLR